MNPSTDIGPTPAYRALNYVESFAPRNELIRAIDSRTHVDLVVIGGGVHGAWSALLASLSGLSVVLFEGRDYASQTSSRSSKMAHGGLRYLESFDFRQVFEGIRQRDLLLTIAPHLVRTEKFLLPLPSSSSSFLSKLKYKVGLSLYDLFRKQSSLRHEYIPEGDTRLAMLQENGLGRHGAFQYVDGLMKDCRLVLEIIYAAREEGAFCLNHAPVTGISRHPDGTIVTWQDSLTGSVHEVRCGAVMNCGGPWVSQVSPRYKQDLRFSRGVHLIFKTPWHGPSLLLPLPEEPGRYYFVWPHESGTLVGTTEREVSVADYDPLPQRDEIEEILARLKRDLPRAALDASTVLYAFAGVRSLPLRSGPKGEVGSVSRRHRWEWHDGVLTLLGGKFTTAEWTAREGLAMVLRHSGVKSPIPSFSSRKLPGAEAIGADKIAAFHSLCLEHGVPSLTIDRALARYGARAIRFSEFPSWYELLPGGILKGELLFACSSEQAERVEDVLSRRLEVEGLPGYGLDLVTIVEDTLRNRGSTSARKESLAYREKIAVVQNLLKST